MCSVHGEDAICLNCIFCGSNCVCEYGGCQNESRTKNKI